MAKNNFNDDDGSRVSLIGNSSSARVETKKIDAVAMNLSSLCATKQSWRKSFKPVP